MAFGTDETFITEFKMNPTSCDVPGRSADPETDPESEQETESASKVLLQNINKVWNHENHLALMIVHIFSEI